MVHIGIMKCNDSKYFVNLSVPLLDFNSNDDRNESEVFNLIELEFKSNPRLYSTKKQAEFGLNELVQRLDSVGIDYEIGDWYK